MSFINTLQNYPTVYLTIVAIAGLAIGSFLNVVILRLPPHLKKFWRKECYEFLEITNPDDNKQAKNLSVTYRSHCTKCKHAIRFYDNIPVLSYFILRGRCRDCKKRISPRYPVIEILTALLCSMVAIRYGVSWQAAGGFLLTCVLIVQSTIDLDNTFIPDEITLSMVWLGLLASLMPIFASKTDAIIGACAGYLSLWVVAKVFLLATKKEGMGHGDFKLLAMLGAWLGWQIIPFAILFSAILGSLIGGSFLVLSHKDRNTRIPFGPFIAIAGWVALMWGHEINNWYFNYTGIIF